MKPILVSALLLLSSSVAIAQVDEGPKTLFTNCNVFEGISESLIEDRNVLISGNLIEDFGDASVTAEGAEMGGGGSGLKKTIDAGLLDGPRIYPSGAFLSQTSGHGDLRHSSQRNSNLTPYMDSNAERLGVTAVVDGPDRVISAVRQNLSQGASQIKIMAGGGVASVLDPLHTLQFLPEEIEAAVRAAEDWDTYVAAHVFSDEGIQRCVDAGVKSIEHGFFASRETLQLMKDKGVFLVSQMTGISPYLNQLPALQNEPNKSKLLKAHTLSKNFVENVKAIQPKVVFQTDVVFTIGTALLAQLDYEKAYHAELFGNHAMLKATTSTAGELLAMSGEANPYPGKLGVIGSS